MSTTHEKYHHTTLSSAELFTRSKLGLYDFPPKSDNFEKIIAGYDVVQKLEFQTICVKVAIVCVIFFYTDLSPCCDSVQHMSQQRAGTYSMHAMLFHCVRYICQIILRIHRSGRMRAVPRCQRTSVAEHRSVEGVEKQADREMASGVTTQWRNDAWGGCCV